jgi:hypothetical protein
MTTKYLLLTLFMLQSCASLKKSVTAASIIGALVGSAGGYVFSPEKEDKAKNAFLFGALASGTSAALTYSLYEKPLSQRKLKHMLLEERRLEAKKAAEELPLFDFSPELKKMSPKVDFKPVNKFIVPLKDLPPELKGKVKKQYIIEYQSDAKTLKIGNRTFEISPFKAWEHVYEE